MSDIKMEKALVEAGFSSKDLNILRKYVKKEQTSYLSLLHELNKRFYFSMLLVIIVVLMWGSIYFFGEQHSLISFSIAALIFLVIIYILTPIRLSFKAMKFIRKK